MTAKKATTKPKAKAKKTTTKPKSAPLTGKVRQQMLRDRRDELGLIRLEYWGTKKEHSDAAKIFVKADQLKKKKKKT